MGTNNNRNTNAAIMSGTIASVPEFSHFIYGEKFYTFFIDVKRLSGTNDTINVVISERVWPISDIQIGKKIKIEGQIRTYNRYKDGASKLIINVFAQKVYDDTKQADENDVQLEGYICKPLIYRSTPFGREIADMLIAVNRGYGKSDYIPCILWGRNAKYVSDCPVGKKIALMGRLQSREYEKQLENGEKEKRTAYEVSVYSIEIF